MRCLKALISSLKAIEPRLQNGDDLEWTLVEATWRYAMLETLSWSTSHMGGIVESSLDGALATAYVSHCQSYLHGAHELPLISSCLAGTQDCAIEGPLVHTLQPHLDWFLTYLDATTEVGQESPLIAVYAFKAFLLAWQLLRGSGPEVMLIVGVQTGDEQAALAWAVSVFGRRASWRIGQLIHQNLRSLGDTE